VLTASVTAANKTYDGTNTATISGCSLAGVIGVEVVTCTAGGPNTFTDKNVAAGKTVTATGITLAGADAGNYTVNGSATTTANITVASVTASVSATNKTYDGTATATISSCTPSPLFGADVVTCSPTSASFANKNVGTAKT